MSSGSQNIFSATVKDESNAMVAIVSLDAFVEFITRQMIQYLGKNGSLGIH